MLPWNTVLLLYNTLEIFSQVLQNLKSLNALIVGEAKFGTNYAC